MATWSTHPGSSHEASISYHKTLLEKLAPGFSVMGVDN